MLYGIVDIGIIYLMNQQFICVDGSMGGGYVWQMGGGNFVLFCFGFQGVELFGGGFNVVFIFEQQFLFVNGQVLQGGIVFSWQVWVGLCQDGIGMFGFGCQYDLYIDMFGVYVLSNNWVMLYGLYFGDVDNLNVVFNFNNVVKFISVDFNGFMFGGMFSFGGQVGDFFVKCGYVVVVMYMWVLVVFLVGYFDLYQLFDVVFGGVSGYIGDFVCSNLGVMYCLLQDVGLMCVFGVGGLVMFGVVMVVLIYMYMWFGDSCYFLIDVQLCMQVFMFDIGELNVIYMFMLVL